MEEHIWRIKMNKLYTILAMLIILSGMVVAEIATPAAFVTLGSGSLQNGGGTTFSFITGVASTNIVGGYYWYGQGVNTWPDSIGSACTQGQYIVPVACHVSTSDCMRVFGDDYQKTSTSDSLNLKTACAGGNCRDATYMAQYGNWFIKLHDYYPYTGYYCKAATPAAVATPNGIFTNINIPPNTIGGDSVTITGSYKVTQPGPFVLEASIDPQASPSFNVVVSSSSSSCDGSIYWAGSSLNGVVGTIYDFKFTVKTPTTKGTYPVHVQAWTACSKKGGTQMTAVDTKINVIATQCDATAVTRDIGAALFKINPLTSWTTTSSAATNILNVYHCSQNDINAFCGTKDTDGDGIPDGCDYCPQDKGVPQAANGCHPCFGLDPYATTTQQCYRTYGAQFGIPASMLPIVNPITATTTSCDGNNIITTQTRYFGDNKILSTTACTGEQTCTKGVCQDPVKPVVTVTSQGYECQGSSVVYIQYYSDNTKKINPSGDPCPNGCNNGKCVTATTNGGKEVTPGDTSVTPTSGCKLDTDCTGGNVCQTGTCITPANWCTTNTDCTDGKECLAGYCATPSQPTDTNSTTTQTNNTESTCTEDTTSSCATGGSVISAQCVNGKLETTGNNCAGETPSTPSNPGNNGVTPSTQSSTGFGQTIKNTANDNPWLFYGVIAILVGAIGFFIYSQYYKPKGKHHKRK